MERLPADDLEYASRSEYWLAESQDLSRRRRNTRRNRHPLILSGHGASLQIDRGTLFCRNGFTHYPQTREEFRYFPGDPDLPTRIIISDASGSISFAVLQWLSQQQIPLIQLRWDGEPLIAANSGYSADRKIVKSQYRKLENGDAESEFVNLVAHKFENSISTLKLFPESELRAKVISEIQNQKSKLLSLKRPKALDILGIEGLAAAQYFEVWRGTPLNWKKTPRKIIPAD